VNNERLKHNRGSKGWWDTANRITGRKIQGTLVSSVIPPDVINTYFQTINTDDEYEAPTLQPFPLPLRKKKENIRLNSTTQKGKVSIDVASLKESDTSFSNIKA